MYTVHRFIYHLEPLDKIPGGALDPIGLKGTEAEGSK